MKDFNDLFTTKMSKNIAEELINMCNTFFHFKNFYYGKDKEEDITRKFDLYYRKKCQN